MNREQFEKLNTEIQKSPQIPTNLNLRLKNENIFFVIDIYKKHLHLSEKEHHWNKRGIKRLRGLGEKRIKIITDLLSSLGLPEIEEAEMVVKEYNIYQTKMHCISSDKFDDKVSTQIMIGFLKSLGRKHDPETIQKVLEITE